MRTTLNRACRHRARQSSLTDGCQQRCRTPARHREKSVEFRFAACRVCVVSLARPRGSRALDFDAALAQAARPLPQPAASGPVLDSKASADADCHTTTATISATVTVPPSANIHDHRHPPGPGSSATRVRTRARNSGDGSTASIDSISRSSAASVTCVDVSVAIHDNRSFNCLRARKSLDFTVPSGTSSSAATSRMSCPSIPASTITSRSFSGNASIACHSCSARSRATAGSPCRLRLEGGSEDPPLRPQRWRGPHAPDVGDSSAGDRAPSARSCERARRETDRDRAAAESIDRPWRTPLERRPRRLPAAGARCTPRGTPGSMIRRAGFRTRVRGCRQPSRSCPRGDRRAHASGFTHTRRRPAAAGSPTAVRVHLSRVQSESERTALTLCLCT